ncbi:MAG: DUF1256 domain-containing protein [Clostridia bacterium]|nr:DUF1256 domain-containing protein [Clostridia bacterium]
MKNNVGKNPIIACIGSTKIISDSLGPIVGQLLLDKYHVEATVVGSLLSPLNAVNLVERMNKARLLNPFGKIIAVDAYESTQNEDSIRIINGGIKPGLASGKDLPRTGDYSIIASAQKTNGHSCCLGKVYALADKIAKLISFITKRNDVALSSFTPDPISALYQSLDRHPNI